MTCSIFALDGCVHGLWGWLLGLLPWWTPYAFWGVVALIVLGILAKIKEVAGWPGIIALLGVIAYGVGYSRGRADQPAVPGQPAMKPAPKPPYNPATHKLPDLPPRSLTES